MKYVVMQLSTIFCMFGVWAMESSDDPVTLYLPGNQKMLVRRDDKAVLRQCELFKSHISSYSAGNAYDLASLHVPGFTKFNIKKYLAYMQGKSYQKLRSYQALAGISFADCFGTPSDAATLDLAARSILYCSDQIRNQNHESYRSFLKNKQDLALDMLYDGIQTIDLSSNLCLIPYVLHLVTRSSHLDLDVVSCRLNSFLIDEKTIEMISESDVKKDSLQLIACMIQKLALTGVSPSKEWVQNVFPYLKRISFQGAQLQSIQSVVHHWTSGEPISFRDNKIEYKGLTLALKRKQFKKCLRSYQKKQVALAASRVTYVSPQTIGRLFMCGLMLSCFVCLIPSIYERVNEIPPLEDHYVSCDKIGHPQCIKFACQWTLASVCDQIGTFLCPEFICECVPYLLQSDHTFMCSNQ